MVAMLGCVECQLGAAEQLQLLCTWCSSNPSNCRHLHLEATTSVSHSMKSPNANA